jgi:transcription initiation factor TFIIB
MTDDDIDSLLFGLNVNTNSDTNQNTCINCKSNKMVKDESNGYNVCDNCGVINENYLDNSGVYESENGNASYGSITNYYFPKSALGTKIKLKGYNKMGILQNQSQIPYKEKSLMDEMRNIQNRCKQHDIKQNIIDCAKSLYKKVSDSKHTSGSRKGKNRIMRCINRKSMIAACLFYACKLQGEPRTSKEIASIYSLETKHVNKGYRKFMDFVDVNELSNKMMSSQSSDYIKRYSKKN